MVEQTVYVSVDLDGETQRVGRLWFHQIKGRESCSFQYEDTWLSHPNHFALSPQLPLTTGTFHTQPGKAVFGALSDSAPDRWGRLLMRRAHFYAARQANETPSTLTEADYLLGVSDEARSGALRFSFKPEGPYLSSNKKTTIPPLIELSRLLTASDHVIQHAENATDLKILLAPGSSLGGARPKAVIKDHKNQLAIAKFPRQDDEYSIVHWEAVALQLAKLAGINVPHSRLELINARSVLIIERFDRNKKNRIPFISAMSLIAANDNEEHSYLELVDALRQQGSQPQKDIIELWKRIVFNILISNTDDHLRNHGFLLANHGWQLSPLYDVNPVPIMIKPRILTLAINLEDNTASLDLALSVIHEFGLSLSTAKKIIQSVANAVTQWRQVAKQLGVNANEIAYMASAFEHDDLQQAKRI